MKFRFKCCLVVVLFFLFLSFFSDLTVYAQGSGNIVSSEFSCFPPKLLVDYPSSGYIAWNTSFGVYVFGKANQRIQFYFVDRYGVKQIEKSVFWINTTATIDYAKVSNVNVMVANDTFYRVDYDCLYKGGGLTKDTVVGTFSMSWNFYVDRMPKITVSFSKNSDAWMQGGLGDFNIIWVVLPLKEYVKLNETYAVSYLTEFSRTAVLEEDKQCEVGDSPYPMDWSSSWIKIVWDDVEGVTVLKCGSEKVWGGKGITVSFPANTGLIDPSVVGTSTDVCAVSYPYQRKSFYANGRFWVFYSDGTNMVYRTSTDGVNWSAATTIEACSYGYRFSVWFDGTYIHYARYYSYVLYYRRGTPNSDGTITWSAAEQTVHSGSSASFYFYPCIAVDSGGHAWIGVTRYDGTGYYPYVFKNANTDGTWSTAAGFPYRLSTTASSYWRVQPVPLTNLKVYVIYCYSGALPLGRLYDGTTWGSEESDLADYAIQSGHSFSAVNEGDNVHFVYIRYSRYQIRYNKRTYGVGWETNDVLVQDTVESTTAPALSIDTTTNNLYCFWTLTGTDHVYYKKCVGGTWDSTETDWIDESEDTIYYGYILNSFYQAYGSYIGLAYVTKSASPYNVKFAYLTLAVGKIWHDIAAWTLQLLTRQWNLAGTWTLTLNTLGWHDIAIWIEQLIARQWMLVGTWTENLITCTWQIAAEWNIQLITRIWQQICQWTLTLYGLGWHLISAWTFQLIACQWNPIAIWNFILETSFAKVWRLIVEWNMQLVTCIWQSIATWIINLQTRTWHNIAVWTTIIITRVWQTIVEWTIYLGKIWHNITLWIMHITIPVSTETILALAFLAFILAVAGISLALTKKE